MGDPTDTTAAPPSGATYIGSDPSNPGYHLVLDPSGQTNSYPTEALPDAMLTQAVNQMNLPQVPQGPLGNTSGDNSVPVPAPQPTLGAKLMGLGSTYAPPGMQPLPASAPPAAPASGAATVPVPSNLTFQPPAGAPPAPPQMAKPSGGGAGGAAPNALDQLGQQTVDAKTAAIKEQQVIDSDLAAGKLGVGQADAAAQQGIIDQQRANAQQWQQQVQDQLAQAKATNDKFQNMQVDPNHYLGSLSTGEHALTALSFILSGFGSGMQGKDNLAVKAYNDKVTADIEAQKYNIQHGKEASEQAMALAKEYQAAGLSKQQSLEAMGLSIRQKSLTDMSNQALALGGRQAQATADAALAPVKMDIQQQTAKLAQDHATTVKTNVETGNAVTQGQISKFQLGQMKQQQSYLQSLGLPAGAQPGEIVHGSDGSIGLAGRPEDVDKFNEEVKPSEDLRTAVSNVKSLRLKPLVNRAALQGPAKLQLQQAIEGMAKNGSLSQRTVDLIAPAAGDPDQLWHLLPGQDEDAKLNYLTTEANDASQAAAARHGVRWIRPPAYTIPQTLVGKGG